MIYDTFRGNRNDPVALRQMAADSRQREAESFERCDTDGFLSQWTNAIGAQLYEAQAHIAERGGRAEFTGLYEGARRVRARLVSMPAYNAPWCTVYKWLLDAPEAARFGRKYLPSGDRSRVQKQLGLTERQELAPAVAFIGGKGKGLSGCASAYVTRRRTGDQWGSDATVIEEVQP